MCNQLKKTLSRSLHLEKFALRHDDEQQPQPRRNQNDNWIGWTFQKPCNPVGCVYICSVSMAFRKILSLSHCFLFFLFIAMCVNFLENDTSPLSVGSEVLRWIRDNPLMIPVLDNRFSHNAFSNQFYHISTGRSIRIPFKHEVTTQKTYADVRFFANQKHTLKYFIIICICRCFLSLFVFRPKER